LNNLFGPLKFRYGVLCLVASIGVALIAYFVGHTLHTTYDSSGTIRIAVASENGISDPNVTAANDLASQYAQLVDSSAVQQLTAQRLDVPVSQLNGALSGSTVAAQNIVQVTASGSTPGEAVARAQAATKEVRDYVSSLINQEGQQYLSSIRSALATLGSKKGGPPGTTASIVSAKAQAVAQGARDMAGNMPGLQIVDVASSASESSPKPSLYALIAFVVALIVTGRIAFTVSRPASASAESTAPTQPAPPADESPVSDVPGDEPPASDGPDTTKRRR